VRKRFVAAGFFLASFVFLPLAPLSASVDIAASAGVQDKDPWHCDLYLYFWPAGLDGDVGAADHSAHTSLKFEDIIHDLKIGGSAAFQVSKGGWFLLNDVIYLDLSHKTSETVPPGVTVDATLGTRVLMEMLAVGRQWEKPVRWKAFIGARYFYGRVRLDAIEQLGPADPEAIVTKTDEWVTPVIGAEVSLPFNDKLSFNFTADVGAADDSFNWEAIPTMGWKFNKTVTALVGYRLLDIRHKKDKFKIDTLMHGPIVGLKISF